jgi:hypothetical protein
MVIKLLTNGCSFSRGPTAWSNHVARSINADLVNLAQSGAGNTYIRQSTIGELSQRSYDLVLIMWTGLERIDIQVEEIDFFETPYTSKYQSSQNDWPEKIVIPINDQDYVEKNWVFGVGYMNSDTFLRKNDLFPGLYKYIGQQEHIRRSMIDMICLQDFLKARNIDYAFSFYQNYLNDLQSHKSLWNLIDHTNLIPGDLYSIACEMKNFDDDKIHPGIDAHQHWGKLVLDYLGRKE